MSGTVNKATLVGRLGKDPEIKYTSSGQAVANFSIATDESYKDKSGEKIKKTEWHNIVVWGNSVESFIQPYIHKGDLVYAEGKLQTRSWDDKDGQKRYTTEINVTEIKMLSGGSDDRQAVPQARTQQAQGRSQTQRPVPQQRTAPQTRAAVPEAQINDEDIPF